MLRYRRRKDKNCKSEKNNAYVENIDLENVDNILQTLQDTIDQNQINYIAVNNIVENVSHVLVDATKKPFGPFISYKNFSVVDKRNKKPWFRKECK